MLLTLVTYWESKSCERTSGAFQTIAAVAFLLCGIPELVEKIRDMLSGVVSSFIARKDGNNYNVSDRGYV